MYETYFGFRDTPFRLSADEKFRYAHKNYLRASAYLAYALQQGEGFVMITGQPGSGKTTLVRDVISELDTEKHQILNLVTSQLHAEELLRKVALEYGLPAETYNKATLLTCIQKHLSNLFEQGRRSILFLDEAQNLSFNGLEELRLLSNLQQGSHSLLQIVLTGHDELRELLLGPGMEHIQQRLIAICQIQPMTEEQTREYIIHRLGVVGWRQDPCIDEDVYHLIHQASQGVPRNINHLMSRLLLYASLEEKHELADEDALTVIEELVDEQRISLAGQLSAEQFATQYRNAKQHQEMRRAVGDHPRGESMRQGSGSSAAVPKHVQNEKYTQNIADNFLSAIDAVPLEVLEDLDAPDSDWLVWKDESHQQTERQSTLPQMSDDSRSGAESKVKQESIEKDTYVLPPNQEPGQPAGDHPKVEPIRHASSKAVKADGDDLIERPQNVADNFLSAIEDLSLESLDQWDSPDSDWLIWKDEPQPRTERQTLLPQVSGEPSDRSDAKAMRQPNPSGEENDSGASLPSADDIWTGSLDSKDLGSMFSEPRKSDSTRGSKFSKSTTKRTKQVSKAKQKPARKQKPRSSSSADSEHRWGGVWFMSNESGMGGNGSPLPNVMSPARGGLPPVPVQSAAPSLSVDENLSMPSLWVDGCPEVNARQVSEYRIPPRKSGMKQTVLRSLMHIAAWVVVGGVLMLLVRMFPEASGRLWQEVEAKFLHEQAATRESAIPSGEEQPRVLEVSQSPDSSMQPPQTLEPFPQQQTDTSLSAAELDKTLGVGDADVNSYENIVLATRYFVYFDFNKFSIPTQYLPLLKSIQYKMLMDENSFLKITGYADPQGNQIYNDRLSLKRAEEVKRFFSQRGIDEARLQVAAVGAVGPESGPDTRDNRRGIRRVEVILFPN